MGSEEPGAAMRPMVGGAARTSLLLRLTSRRGLHIRQDTIQIRRNFSESCP